MRTWIRDLRDHIDGDEDDETIERLAPADRDAALRTLVLAARREVQRELRATAIRHGFVLLTLRTEAVSQNCTA
ncbi:MAG TPA: hypothetical protein VFQ53_40665 [Kofleriaceae bacterium]|nr:hypothetical protein [Kofleriaceae bacterium]